MVNKGLYAWGAVYAALQRWDYALATHIQMLLCKSIISGGHSLNLLLTVDGYINKTKNSNMFTIYFISYNPAPK